MLPILHSSSNFPLVKFLTGNKYISIQLQKIFSSNNSWAIKGSKVNFNHQACTFWHWELRQAIKKWTSSSAQVKTETSRTTASLLIALILFSLVVQSKTDQRRQSKKDGFSFPFSLLLLLLYLLTLYIKPYSLGGILHHFIFMGKLFK